MQGVVVEPQPGLTVTVTELKGNGRQGTGVIA